MKTKRAGKEYTCEGCSNPINKGDSYYIKSKSFNGGDSNRTMECRDGIPTEVVSGLTFKYQYHAECQAV